MKKAAFVFSLAFLAALAWALDESDGAPKIDAALLDSAVETKYIEDKSPVPPSRRATARQLRAIGRSLARQVGGAADGARSPAFSAERKYQALRAEQSGSLAGADVFFIGKNAEVTTIKCLRLILSGYVEDAFGASGDQADELAEKICWWNNNHYGDSEYFEKNFARGALDAFAGETSAIGLAASYKRWRGGTRVVIPLSLSEGAAETAGAAGAGGGSPLEGGGPLGAESGEGGALENGGEGFAPEPTVESTAAYGEAEFVVDDAQADGDGGADGAKVLLALMAVAMALLILLLIKVALDSVKAAK